MLLLIFFNDGTEISAVYSSKDLGVTVISTFKTSLHCQQAANRARRILFVLRRAFAVLTPEIFRPLYLAVERPILGYGQQASSPNLRRDIALMQRIQRQATRTVKCMRMSTAYIFSPASQASRRPHLGLQHISRSP